VTLIADRHIDRDGRQFGHLRVDGKDVGEILIREGLCAPYSGHAKRRDWCVK
jgi:endonuclease YncB( thermonuclease family)